MANNTTIMINPASMDIPTATESEKLIAEKARKAIEVLNKYNAMDLVEILGLSPHVEREN